MSGVTTNRGEWGERPVFPRTDMVLSIQPNGVASGELSDEYPNFEPLAGLLLNRQWENCLQ